MRKLHRRGLLKATVGAAVIGLTLPARAKRLTELQRAKIRGSINAAELGVAADAASSDQSRAFARMLQQAAARETPVFLPPGRYVVSDIELPRQVRLSGVSGATRIVYGGGGRHLTGDGCDIVDLDGLEFDGGALPLGGQASGLLDLRGVGRLSVANCAIVGSGKSGLALQRVSGRIERCAISGAADAGLYSLDAGRLAIRDNQISDCGNGGILVHRREIADDGTVISGNRVERIKANGGGTGQNGNGINIFRANNVIVAGNSVADCAFSAIRANSASNIGVGRNACLRSGETAIYAEFAFEGASISDNLIDGAANGVSIVNFDKGGRLAVCSGNIVRNLSLDGPYPPDPPGFGVGVNVEADCAVTGNVVEGAPRYGLNLGWGRFLRDIAATGNVIRKCGVGIAVSVVEGAGVAVIADNVIDGAQDGAIVAYRWTEAASGDLAKSGAEAYPNLTIAGNRTG